MNKPELIRAIVAAYQEILATVRATSADPHFPARAQSPELVPLLVERLALYSSPLVQLASQGLLEQSYAIAQEELRAAKDCLESVQRLRFQWQQSPDNILTN